MLPSSIPRCSAMRWASSGCERPANTISRFRGPRSIQCSGPGMALGLCACSPGNVNSIVPMSFDISLFVDLSCPCKCERTRRNVFGDRRARGDPCLVSYGDRSNERILDAGPDVVADLRPALRTAGLVREVDGDVA